MVHRPGPGDELLATAFAARRNETPVPKHRLHRLTHDELLLDRTYRPNMAAFPPVPVPVDARGRAAA